MRSRRGFTIVEMLVVLIIMGLLAGIGLLKYIDLRNTARTASLAGDVRVVHVALLNYHADTGGWPPETGAGQVPSGLGPYLSAGFAASFDRTYYVLDYQNLPVSGGDVIAVAISSSDPDLMAKLVNAFSGRTPFYMSGGTLTYLISGPGGIF